MYAVAKWIKKNGGSSFKMRKCDGTMTCGGMNFFMHRARRSYRSTAVGVCAMQRSSSPMAAS